MIISKLRNISSTRHLVRKALYEFMVRELRGRKFGTIVDIGAGRSPYKKFLEYDKYIPLDVENRSGDPNTVIVDLNEKISLDNDLADCIICTEVLEHLKNPGRALEEMYRVLKPGGVLILTTPMVWPHHEVPNDFFRYTKFGLEYLLDQAGFTDTKIEPGNSSAYTVAQLMVTNLRGWGWRFLVAPINIAGVIMGKISKNYDLPLGHHVVARKALN